MREVRSFARVPRLSVSPPIWPWKARHLAGWALSSLWARVPVLWKERTDPSLLRVAGQDSLPASDLLHGAGWALWILAGAEGLGISPGAN